MTLKLGSFVAIFSLGVCGSGDDLAEDLAPDSMQEPSPLTGFGSSMSVELMTSVAEDRAPMRRIVFRKERETFPSVLTADDTFEEVRRSAVVGEGPSGVESTPMGGSVDALSRIGVGLGVFVGSVSSTVGEWAQVSSSLRLHIDSPRFGGSGGGFSKELLRLPPTNVSPSKKGVPA